LEVIVSLVAFAQDPVANTIAVIILFFMLSSVAIISYFFVKGNSESKLLRFPKASIPILALLGLGVAFYLSFVEVTKAEAICGPIGNCNRVQTSSYALLFGIIPIGVLGTVGYLALLVTWLIGFYSSKPLHNTAKLGIWAMAWFGIAFSIYLTYLEPFVIGATCAWCITSAILMTLIFWASSAPAIEALKSGNELEDNYFEEEDN
jgi:uncharacterized membrane protein